MRLLIFFSFFITVLSSNLFAQTTGTGCFSGTNNVVYSQYLGMYAVYGGSALYPVYSNSKSLPVNYNGYSATKPGNINYNCGEINAWRGDMTTASGPQCIVGTSLSGPYTVLGGTSVNYKINDPAYCGTTSVPLDNGLVSYLLSFSISIIAAYCLRSRSEVLKAQYLEVEDIMSS